MIKPATRLLFLLLMGAWGLATTAIVPQGGDSVDSCDLVEFNHFVKFTPIYDKNNPDIIVDFKKETVFKQFIAYDFDPEKCVFVVRAWRLWRGKKEEFPIKDGNGWRIYWGNEGQKKTVLKFKSYRQTETEEDVEQVNKRVLADNRRKGILNPNEKSVKELMAEKARKIESGALVSDH